MLHVATDLRVREQQGTNDLCVLSGCCLQSVHDAPSVDRYVMAREITPTPFIFRMMKMNYPECSSSNSGPRVGLGGSASSGKKELFACER